MGEKLDCCKEVNVKLLHLCTRMRSLIFEVEERITYDDWLHDSDFFTRGGGVITRRRGVY